MQITLSWQTVVGLAGGIAALAALLGYLFKGYDFVKRQQRQDGLIRALQDAAFDLGRAGLSQGPEGAGLQRPRHRGHHPHRKAHQRRRPPLLSAPAAGTGG